MRVFVLSYSIFHKPKKGASNEYIFEIAEKLTKFILFYLRLITYKEYKLSRKYRES